MSGSNIHTERFEAGNGSAAWWILKAIKRLGDMPEGDILEIVLRGAEDVAEHIRRLEKPGRKILGVAENAGTVTILLTRTGEKPADSTTNGGTSCRNPNFPL